LKFLSHFSHYKLLVAAVAALVTTTSVFGSGVWADGRPDGGTEEADSETIVTTSCGAVLNSVVKTDNASALVAPGAAFVGIPGAFASVTIPAGQTDCIKALYTVEAAALGPDAADFCYVRALVNGVEMNPLGGSAQVLASEDSTAEAAGYEWILRRTAGGANTVFTVVIQWRGEDGDTSCWRDDSTLDVQRLN
jgi:hypothetical protein